MKRYLSCVLFFVAALCAMAEEHYVFRKLNTSNGLSNNMVKTILKDSSGYLWVGTVAGLNRYDGYGFRLYVLGDKDSRNDDYLDDVWTLQQDADGNLWVCSSMRYAVYDSDKDDFSTDTHALLASYGIDPGERFSIYVDSSRDLWVISEAAIYCYDMRQRSLRTLDVRCDLRDNSLKVADNERYTYILLDTDRLVCVNKHTMSISNVEMPQGEGGLNNMFCDRSQGLWLFSNFQNDVYHLPKSGKWEKISLPSSVVSPTKGICTMLDDGAGHIWMGTDHNGLFIYDLQNASFAHHLHEPLSAGSLPANNVSCLYQDDKGTIWLGHNKSGISYCNNDLMHLLNMGICEGLDVSALLSDSRGNLWVGTDGGGLFVLKPDAESMQKIQQVDAGAIVCIEEDHSGKIWVGSYLDGLYCIDKGVVEHYTPSNSHLGSDMIWDLHCDCMGNLWIATFSGVQYLEEGEGDFKALLTPEGNKIGSMCVYSAGDDTLYLGSFDGLYIADVKSKKTELHYSNRRGTQTLKHGYVSNIYRDSGSRLWLGHHQGMTVWDLTTDSMYYIDRHNGLCDDVIRSIKADYAGHVYVSTSNGLSVLYPKWGTGEFSCDIRNYTAQDGLMSTYFNNKAALWRPDREDILYGATDGCVSLFPEKVFREDDYPAAVRFTGLFLGNRRVEVDSVLNGRVILKHALDKERSLRLNHDDHMVTIEFSALDLTGRSGVRYAYVLEGMGSGWMYTEDNKVTFTSLSPGKYRLLVKAVGVAGNESEAPAELLISVASPFYLSSMAISTYVLLVAAFIMLSVQYYRRKHRRRLQAQRQIMEQEQTLRMNEMKLKFFTNVSHDLRTPLTLITAPLQVLLDETHDTDTKKKLLTINSNANRLLGLINSLLDLRKLDAGAEGLHCSQGDFMRYLAEQSALFADYATNRRIALETRFCPKSLQMDFDADKVGKIVNNLLSNAFKYTPDGGRVSLSARLSGSDVVVSVADTGRGISDEAKKHIFERFYQDEQGDYRTGSGIGLHIADEYARMHGGTIAVADNEGGGTVFTLTLPVKCASCTPARPTAPDADTADLAATEEGAEQHPGILVVDDNEEFRDFMADTLSRDYRVFKAENGREALDIIDSEDIRLVVSDVMMPVMDGMELCRCIKEDIHRSHIPVILLTAKAAEEYRLEGLEKGADDYLTKPFNIRVLQLRIRKFMDIFERNHQIFRSKMDVSPSEITITSLDEKLVEKAIAIVEAHIDDTDFSVEALSQELALSRGYLYKKLMAITGKGPGEFIRTIRLKRGRQLLEQSQLQIAEIAYMCGFNSPRRFAQNFKNEFGMLPSEYVAGLHDS